MENQNQNQTLLPVGDYEANVVDYGINETKAGMPQVFVQFHLHSANRNLTWYGGLSNDKAIEITGQALIRCGFRGTDLAVLAVGKAGNHLDLNKKLKLVVEHNTWEGKTSARIKWVNELGGPSNKLDQAGAVQKLGGLNIAGKMIQLQQEMGMTNGQSAQTYQQQPNQQAMPGQNDKPPF